MPRQHIPLPNSYNCIGRMGRSVLWLLVAVSAALYREAQAEFVDDFNIPVTVLVPEGKENDTLRLHLAAYGAPPYGELMDKCGPDSVRLKVLPTVARTRRSPPAPTYGARKMVCGPVLSACYVLLSVPFGSCISVLVAVPWNELSSYLCRPRRDEVISADDEANGREHRDMHWSEETTHLHLRVRRVALICNAPSFPCGVASSDTRRYSIITAVCHITRRCGGLNYTNTNRRPRDAIVWAGPPL